jgi:integrase
MASIQKRHTATGIPSYRVSIRLKGHPMQNATFASKTDAKKWAQATEAAIKEGRHFKTTEAKKHTLAELIDRYIKDVLPTKPKQAGHQQQQLEWWKARIGDYALADISTAMIVQCRDDLGNGETNRGKPRSPATVCRYLAALSHAFTIAVTEWQWLEISPMRHVKKPTEPRGRVRWLDDNERARLLAACQESSNQWLYLCVVLALSTGMRQAELMSLKWADLDLKAGFLILHHTKNNERRRIPLSGLALELLKEHSKLRRLDTPLLFPGNVHADKPIDLRAPWEAALKQAGINDFKWHDLRHSCASYLAMGGASLTEIGAVLGHKSIAMTQRYSHLSENHVAGVLEQMNQKIFG